MEKTKKLNFFQSVGAICFLVLFLGSISPYVAQAEVDSIKVSNYEQDLQNIDGSPKATGKYVVIAKDLYFKTFTDQDSPETRDAAFLVFYKYYNKILENAYKDEVFSNASIMDKEQVRKAEEVAASYGWRIITPEGNIQPNADNNYIAKTFGNIVSPNLKSYLIFAKKTENMAEDAALNINPEEIRERLILGEALVKAYPDSAIGDMVKPVLSDLLYYYLFGLDNSPVYGHSSTKTILPEVKSSYVRFLKENKKSVYFPLVKYFYDVLQKNKFRYTKSVDATLSKKWQSWTK